MYQVLKTSAARDSARRSADMKRVRRSSAARVTLTRHNKKLEFARSVFQSKRDAAAVEAYVQGAEYEVCGLENDQVLIPRASISAFELEADRRGFGPLPWVESDTFQFLVCSAIAANLVLLVLDVIEGTHRTLPPNWAWFLGSSLLVAYSLEMCMRLIHFGPCRFLVDRGAGAMLNITDGVAVGLGIAHHWSHRVALPGVLALRILRLLRGLPREKISDCLFGDLMWTESASWQWFVGGVISFNAIVMGLETEMPSKHWDSVENAMLLFFVFEIGMRFRRVGLSHFFSQGDDQFWNCLDTVIVVTGVCDLWLVPIYEFWLSGGTGDASAPSFAKMMMLMRMLRLMRILRLLRLVKAVRPLYQLATGIMSAMQGMFWVLVLTLVALYAFALVATSFFGEHALVGGTEDYTPNQSALFGNVLDTMFTLFGLMNGQYWSKVSPILDKLPWMKPMYVFFTILSSWALLSVMTSVVSDNMMKVRQEQETKDNECIEEFRYHLNRTMADLIANADPDETGALEKHVYQDMLFSMSHSKVIQQFANLQSHSELTKMLDWLDVTGTGVLEIQDFMQGLDWLNSVVTGKSLLKLEVSMKRRCCGLERAIRELHSDVDTFDSQREAETEDLLQELKRATSRFDDIASQKRREAEEAEAETQALKKTCADLMSVKTMVPYESNMTVHGDDNCLPEDHAIGSGDEGSGLASAKPRRSSLREMARSSLRQSLARAGLS
eukprot:TRINITY_DN37734_c0_g1_i1.p1 TRINITY_DN37734_c0_g1~~TRINITY_DN37734_c0_g1_i1.p1  ORF type:complete len:764 (+),score=101.69 TRINITY_DN37734_c0_g1_i1:118-2292(+)